jgi:hypothetical protein
MDLDNLHEKLIPHKMLVDKLIASKDAEIKSIKEICAILRNEVWKRKTCKICKDCKVCNA